MHPLSTASSQDWLSCSPSKPLISQLLAVHIVPNSLCFHNSGLTNIWSVSCSCADHLIYHLQMAGLQILLLSEWIMASKSNSEHAWSRTPSWHNCCFQEHLETNWIVAIQFITKFICSQCCKETEPLRHWMLIRENEWFWLEVWRWRVQG